MWMGVFYSLLFGFSVLFQPIWGGEDIPSNPVSVLTVLFDVFTGGRGESWCPVSVLTQALLANSLWCPLSSSTISVLFLS